MTPDAPPHRRASSSIAASLVFVAACSLWAADDAQEFIGARVKLTGRWTGELLNVSSLRKWDPSKEEDRGNVAGVVDAVDPGSRTLRIGPIEVVWTDATRFEVLAASDLKAGASIEAIGKRVGVRTIRATLIEPKSASPGYLALGGTVTGATQLESGIVRLTILDIPAQAGRTAYTRARELARDPDDLRPEDQLQVSLFGGPLTIGGEISNSLRASTDRDLDPHGEDDSVSLGQELKVELFYAPTDSVWVYLKNKALYEADVYSEDGAREFEQSVERDEHWLYVASLFGSNVSLQIGRQRFRDDRRWWWDESLDALRLHYDTFTTHGEFAIAEELWKDRFEAGAIDPEDEQVLRALGSYSWSRTRNLTLSAFGLYAFDHSGGASLADRTSGIREDESDGRLVWLGARADGRIPVFTLDPVDYHLTAATVTGRETRIEYDTDPDGQSRVDERSRHNVFGLAFDSAASWALPLPLRPSLSVGYAFATGDRSPDGRTDHTFRQTGLQENRARHHGAIRFRYYGEVLQPELSNLHVATAGIGFPLLGSSSIDVVYHYFEQVVGIDEVQGSRLRADPDGEKRTLGQELDLILGIQEWEHLEIRLAGGVFLAGPAFGDNEGEISVGLSLKLDYSF